MSVKSFVFAAVAAMAMFAANAARAADMPSPPIVMQQPMPVVSDCCEGWYLRGDVGVGMKHLKNFEWTRNPAAPATDFQIQTFSIADDAFIGAGIGYEFNNWLRFDVTGEYRMREAVNAFGSFTTGCTGGNCLDVYSAQLKSWVFLANAYADLGTWWCFTPFVGFGVGGAYLKFENLSDFGVPGGAGDPGMGFGHNPSQWNLAWAAHAGVAYNVSKNLKVELAYRYLNMGSISDTIDCVGGCLADSYKLKEVTSHDFKLGLRWVCCDDSSGQQQYYAPQPAYIPPPQQQVLQLPPQQQYVAPPPPQQYYAPPPAPAYQQPLMRKG